MAGRSACLVCERMSLCSGTADLLIKNIGIIMRAGFPSNSKMYGVLQLYTTGQTPMCGARIIDLIMTTIIYMISFKSRPVCSDDMGKEQNLCEQLREIDIRSD